MTKLQKRPPPAYPGLHFELLSTVDRSVQYENLPRNTSQPVLMGPSSYQPTVSRTNDSVPGLNTRISGTTSATFHPSHRRAMSNQADFTTLPSNYPTIGKRSSLPDISYYTSQMPMETVDLGQVENEPGSGETNTKVRVAKDGHEGQRPPAYRRRSTESTDQRNDSVIGAVPSSHTGHNCRSSSKGKRRSNDQFDRRDDPTSRGQTRVVVSPTRGQHETNTAHERTFSDTTTINQRASPPVDRAAGHTSRGTGRYTNCQRCGKYKKPALAIAEEDEGQSTLPEPKELPTLPATANPPNTESKPLTIIPPSTVPLINVNGTQFNIVPPSASTYNGSTSPFSPRSEDSPLVAKITKVESKPFRNSSIIRSLSRRLSKKDKINPREEAVISPLQSQQLANKATYTGEENADRLIDTISISTPHTPNDDTDYKQHLQQPVERSKSPFSFMEASTEEDAFELGVIAEENEHKDLKLKDVPDKKEPEITCTPIYTSLDMDDKPENDKVDQSPSTKSQKQTRNLLAVPGTDGANERPGLSRFRSLRGDMSRAASLTRSTSMRRLESLGRSTSLKRLSSLKTVHRNWYREDMALEGVGGESIYAY